MRVSIIITNYNYAAWLGAAIDSALAQNWPDVEVIVVDDGSTDGSADVISRYGDRLRAMFQANQGQCRSCNDGFRQSSGDVIIFLDSDDVLLPGAASLHIAAFTAQPGTVKSCGYLDVIDEDGKHLGYRIPRKLPDSGDYRRATQECGLEGYQLSFTSGQAWSRGFLDQVMPMPVEDITGPDGYLSAIDRLFGPLAFVHEPVAFYRRHTRNRGPARFRFDEDFMQRRLGSKRRRIAFAEEWLERLGLDYDAAALRRISDWRLVLMQYVLHRMDTRKPPVSLRELLASPFQKPLRSKFSAAATSMALMAVRLLPKPHDLKLARSLLCRAYRARPRRPA